MVMAIAERTGERLVGYTSQGIPIILAEFAADVSDLSALAEIRRTETEIMKLPPDERNEAWTSLSPVIAAFSRNEASFKALEQLYTRDGVRFNGLQGVDDGGRGRAWIECYDNARAVRERKALATELVVRAIREKHHDRPYREIILASIASGSARCVVEALRQTRSVRTNARLLDWDEEAREYCVHLARQFGLDGKIQPIAGDVLRIARYLFNNQIDIVEAVGILDYLDDRLAIHLLKQIHKIIAEFGVVIASNIMPNPESEFLHTAIGWRPMHYRVEENFIQLFLDSGFLVENCVIYKIPLGIYCIIEARR